MKGMEALHEGAEGYLLELFVKADVAREHRGCGTLMERDISMAKFLNLRCTEIRKENKMKSNLSEPAPSTTAVTNVHGIAETKKKLGIKRKEKNTIEKKSKKNKNQNMVALPLKKKKKKMVSL